MTGRHAQHRTISENTVARCEKINSWQMLHEVLCPLGRSACSRRHARVGGERRHLSQKRPESCRVHQSVFCGPRKQHASDVNALAKQRARERIPDLMNCAWLLIPLHAYSKGRVAHASLANTSCTGSLCTGLPGNRCRRSSYTIRAGAHYIFER